MQLPNNNRNSPSADFQALNTFIVKLDNDYNTIANKPSWEAGAIWLTGQWQLCADCELTADGQRLFRQVNYYLLTHGFAELLVCPFHPSANTFPDMTWIHMNGFLGPGWYTPGPELVLEERFYIMQYGLGLLNPTLQVPPNTPPSQNFFADGTNNANILEAMAPKPNAIACPFTVGGSPGMKRTITATP